MSSNWKKDLDDPNAEVKNELKKGRLYLLAFAFIPALSGIIGVLETGILRLFRIPVYGKGSMWFRYIAAFFGTVVIIRFMKKWREQGRHARAAYDENIMAKAVQEILPGAVLEPEGSIDSMDFYVHGVVPDFDDSQGSYLIRFEQNGKAFAFSNLTLTRREKDRNDRYYNKAVFVGQAYELCYKSRMPGTVRIMTTSQWMGREVLDGFRRQDKVREEKIETENEVFNRQFDVYATDAHAAFYVVTPVVMERLLSMKAKYGSFGVAVSGDKIMIALCSRYYLFEPPTDYREIERISVEKSRDEIGQMLVFAKLLEVTISGK